MTHYYPPNEALSHIEDESCPCKPHVEFDEELQQDVWIHLPLKNEDLFRQLHPDMSKKILPLEFHDYASLPREKV